MCMGGLSMSRFSVLFFCLFLTNGPASERLGEIRKFECGAEFQREITVKSGDLIQISARGGMVPDGKIDNLRIDILKQDASKVQCLGIWLVPEFDKSGRRVVGGLGMPEMMTLIKTIEPGTVVVKVTTIGKDVQGNTFEFKVNISPTKS